MKNTVKKNRYMICLIALTLLNITAIAQSKIYNVTDYGANPNDKKDDTENIQQCINDALKYTDNITIQFPKSKSSANGYIINNTLKLEIVNNNSITLVGNVSSRTNLFMQGKATRWPIYSGFLIRSKPDYSGTVSVKGFNIEGKFLNSLQSYIDKANGAKGIFILNVRKAVIAQNRFKNIYGDGIWCIGNDNLDPSDKITIENNQFLNVFGLNLSPDKYTGGQNYDNYGDGINIANLQNVTVRNNIIQNNLLETKSYGRAGIVLETNTLNCTISNNTIYGYDRGIHIEGDKGGHIVSGNTIGGSNMAVFVFSVKHSESNPIQITNNKFSYNNECTTLKLPHLHAAYPVFIYIHGAQSQHLVGTTIRYNTFTYNNPATAKRIINDFLSIPLQGGVSWCGNTYYTSYKKLTIDADCK